MSWKFQELSVVQIGSKNQNAKKLQATQIRHVKIVPTKHHKFHHAKALPSEQKRTPTNQNIINIKK